MIKVFCARRGSGKTKKLIQLANENLSTIKGNSVYIDDDSRQMMQLKSEIRFVTTDELKISDCDSFYGLLCGLISQNYDIENIYIDELSNIIKGPINDYYSLFKKIEMLSQKFKFNIYINVNCEDLNNIPDFIKEYVA
ncbi:MAG: hypothetical protein ACRDA5_06940 [Clostridium sp.]